MYEIEIRGEKNPEEIKVVSGIPQDGKFMPIKFPCLSVHVTHMTDSYPDAYYCVTWSNYRQESGQNPGKFKIQRIEHRKQVLYEKNIDGKTAKKNGKPIVDYLSMAKLDLPTERVEMWDSPPESETIGGALRILAETFDQSTALRVLELFTNHDLFQRFLLRKAA